MDDHSVKIAAITSEINTLAKNTLDEYYKLTKSNSKLCGTFMNRSESYLQKIQTATKDEAMKQHRVVVQAFENGLKELNSAQEGREKTRQSFLDAARKNAAKITRLTGEFNDKLQLEAFHQIVRLEVDAIKSRRCILQFCWDTELTRQIKSLIQKLNEKQTKVLVELGQAFKNSDFKMKNTQKKFDDEFYSISKVITHVKTTSSDINEIIKEDLHDPYIISLIKEDVERLIAECRKYIAEHEF